MPRVYRRGLDYTHGMARTRTVSENDPQPTGRQPNPVWFMPVVVGLLILGLLWVLVYYLSGTLYPVGALGAWNLVVGLGIAFVGLLMATRWR